MIQKSFIMAEIFCSAQTMAAKPGQQISGDLTRNDPSKLRMVRWSYYR